MQKGVFCLFFSGIIRKNVFTQLFVPQASSSARIAASRTGGSFRFRPSGAKSLRNGGFYEAFDCSRHARTIFVTGALEQKEAQGDCGKRRLQNQRNSRTAEDTHRNSLPDKEGLHLPVAHCIEELNGHCLCPAVEQALKENRWMQPEN